MNLKLTALLIVLCTSIYSANYHTWSTPKIYIMRQQIVMEYMAQKKKRRPNEKIVQKCEINLKKLDDELMRRTMAYKM